MKNFLSSTKGKIIAGAATLAVIAGVIVLIILLNTGYRNIRVEDLTGTSKVTSLLSVSDAFKGQNLKSGESVEVFEKSDLTLALDSDKHVVANELTKFSLEAFGTEGKDSRTVIHLEKGSITNEIDNKLLPSESYVVESPNASMSVRGTIFTVNVFFDSEGFCHTVVEVEKGVVEFAEKGTGNDEVKTLNAGDKAEVVSRVDENNNNNSSESGNSSSSGNSGRTGEVLTFGDYEYKYNEELGGIEIMAYKGTDEVVSIPAEIEGNKVVRIRNYAFHNCKVTSVTIPNSVTEIGVGAFAGCEALTSITIPDSVTKIESLAFINCKTLTSITIPNSVTVIEPSTFEKCCGLTSIEISNSVTKIGEYAFNNCAELTSITIPDSVTEIGDSTFQLCRKLKSVTMSNSVTTIGDRAFNQCNALKSVEIPYGVKVIGEFAFSGCYNLTSVKIPNSVTEIGHSAFYSCIVLHNVEIPDSVTVIGDSAFYHCSTLTSVTVPDSVTKIGKNAFYDSRATIYYKGKTYIPDRSGEYEGLYTE